MHTIAGFGAVRRRLAGPSLMVMVAALALAALGSLAQAEPLGPDVITSPDTTGNVGEYTSLALDADGYPVISYYDTANGDLKVLRYTNPDCSGTQSSQTVDSGNDVGRWTSLALDTNGYPVISYYDATNRALKVLHCTNPDCSGTQTPQTVDSTSNTVGRYTSLALDTNGYPVISYWDDANRALKVVHCSNADCSGTQTPQAVDTTGRIGGWTSLALDTNGYPVISYYDLTSSSLNFTDGDLKVVHCTNVDCSGTQTPETADTGGIVGNVGEFTSLALDANGHPVISYFASDRYFLKSALKVLHCNNVDCSGTQTPQTVDSAADVGAYTSLALDTNGYPVISYLDSTTFDLKVLHCTNPDCSGTQSPWTVDSAGNVGQFTSLALDANGSPVVSYYDLTNGDLELVHCYDPDGCGGQDQDLDGVAHSQDNCAAVANADQADADSDGVGNACDPADGRIPTVCVGFEGANVIIGTAVGEKLTGTSGRDVILGLGGDDVLVGAGGDDCILGGSGADIIRGGSGADIIRGNSGNDRIFGNKGNDTINGGKGTDRCNGGPGTDIKIRCES